MTALLRAVRWRWVAAAALAVALLVTVVGGRRRAWARQHVEMITGETGITTRCAACHDVALSAEPESVRYLSPINLAVSPDGSTVYVVCDTSEELLAVDPVAGSVVGRLAIPGRPHGICLSADGGRAFVTRRWADSVCEVSLPELSAVRELAVGGDPCAVALAPFEKTLYVGNCATNNISVVDLTTGDEIRRLAAGRAPFDAAVDAERGLVLVTNRLSLEVGPRSPPVTEVTVIDAELGRVVDRVMLPGAHLAEGIAVEAGSGRALVCLVRPKNLLPATQVAGGWVMTTGIGLLPRDPTDRTQQVLLDQANRYFADPYDVVTVGSKAYVSHSGADCISVVDLTVLDGALGALSDAHRARCANDLGLSAEFVTGRIPTSRCPKGLATSPDGSVLYVANRLSDTITVIDTRIDKATGEIELGGPGTVSLRRRGERLFNGSGQAFQGVFSCRSCHPDEQLDGLTYDLQPDGLGLNILDNRTLRGLRGTAPFKWSGHNPSLYRQCGPRFSKWLSRIDPPAFEDLNALVAFIWSLDDVPNPRRTGGQALSSAETRGREQFYRTATNDGPKIHLQAQCDTCHPPPLYTNLAAFDVGTGRPSDTKTEFDTPQLINTGATAPYLHDGSSATLEEIWTVHNPDDKHGITNDMAKHELNDLIAFLKGL